MQEAKAQWRSFLSETKLERVLIEGIGKLINGHTIQKGSQALLRTSSHCMPSSTEPDDQTSVYSGISSHGSLADLDTRFSGFARKVLEEIPLERFLSNYNCCLNVKMRLPQNSSIRWDDQKARGALSALLHPLDLLHDNLFHATALFDILKRESLTESSVKGKVEQAWQRIIAVLAICYGCTAEPTFFQVQPTIF